MKVTYKVHNVRCGDIGCYAQLPRLPPGVAGEAAEKGVCTQLAQCVNALHELVQTAVPPGPSAEGLLRVTARLYSTVTLLTKHVRHSHVTRHVTRHVTQHVTQHVTHHLSRNLTRPLGNLCR